MTFREFPILEICICWRIVNSIHDARCLRSPVWSKLMMMGFRCVLRKYLNRQCPHASKMESNRRKRDRGRRRQIVWLRSVRNWPRCRDTLEPKAHIYANAYGILREIVNVSRIQNGWKTTNEICMFRSILIQAPYVVGRNPIAYAIQMQEKYKISLFWKFMLAILSTISLKLRTIEMSTIWLSESRVRSRDACLRK